ncbi:MAG: nucleotidyltransferase family protein [Prevotella sp.]|nr:nucleotidyltransferase family protein [Prevotella sp.]MBR6944669.1 nucleotidyltransferase family protein [Prevotella sp.]
MKTIILAAGYATRLYPLTENTPKQLLNVGGRTIMGRMLDDLDAISDVHENVIVTNHKFVNHFKEWMDNATYCNAIHLLDDGSENENDRMGAVGDLVAAIEAMDIDDDILVVYADSLLDFSFDTFVDFFKEKSASCIMYHPMDDEEELKKYAVVEVNKKGRVKRIEEKPQKPRTNLAVPPFYIYRKEDLPLIREAINNGCNVDSPGNLVEYLYDKTPIYAMEMPGRRFAISDIEEYEQLKKTFPG